MPSLPTIPIEVPVIETERLVLRLHRAADLDACASMWADPAVIHFLGGEPLKREDVWSRLLRYVGHWAVMGFGFWAVEEKESGAFIGDLGFMDFKRGLYEPMADIPEIGWILAARAHGKGYATEAVRAALAWGDSHFPSRRTVCMINPENTASLRVAEKCGYEKDMLTAYKGRPVNIFFRS